MYMTNERKARAYRQMHDIVGSGWTKRKLHNSTGTRHCIMGAVEQVTDLSPVIHHDLGELVRQDLTLMHPHVKCVENWNDMPWRRKYQVMRFLRKMAENYEELARKDYVNNLQIKLNNLENQVTHLRVRVAQLEAENIKLRNENSWLKARRVKVTARQLVESNTELAKLDAELDAAARELESVQTV